MSPTPHILAAPNKSLAKFNKSRTGGEATKKRKPPTNGCAVNQRSPSAVAAPTVHSRTISKSQERVVKAILLAAATICAAVVTAGPANAQCSYALNDVGRFHGYLSGPCNGAALGYNGAYPYHPNARAGAHPTVVAPKVITQTNGHNVGACDATCQAKCQATWRAGGLPNVGACYAKWSRLSANPELARACEFKSRQEQRRLGCGL